MADQEGEVAYSTLVRGQKLPDGFLDAFYRQVEKDLRHSFSRGSLQQLQEQVATFLEQEMQSSRMEHLLYRIDLSEDYASECLARGNPMMALAEAVLKREAVKVMFRLQHSGKD